MRRLKICERLDINDNENQNVDTLNANTKKLLRLKTKCDFSKDLTGKSDYVTVLNNK